MIKQLRTWYIITTKEKISTKAHLIVLWSDTPEAQVTNFARQLDRSQVKCKYHGVTVTNYDNMDDFVAHMYACGLFKAKLMDYWEETVKNLLRATQPQFTCQFNKEQ